MSSSPTVNLFVRSTTGNILLDCPAQITSGQLYQMIQDQSNLNDDFKISLNGRFVARQNDFTLQFRQPDVHLDLHLSLLGGKGGFGSMLRAIGAQIEKTTNKEACRDLSGRRLRDVNAEKRIKNWVEKQAEKQKEEEQRKRDRLERLRSEPKVVFKDNEYMKEREEIPFKIEDAVKYSMKNKKKVVETTTAEVAASASTTSSNSSSNSETELAKTSGSGSAAIIDQIKKRKNESVNSNKKKKKKCALWLGDDLDDDDSEEDDESNHTTVAEDGSKSSSQYSNQEASKTNLIQSIADTKETENFDQEGKETNQTKEDLVSSSN